MAFTTVPGASSTDATTLVGTSGIDFASITDNTKYFVGGQEAADTIGLSANVTGLTVRGGQGNDTLTFSAGSTYTESFINTNANTDTVGANAANARANTFNATLLGGQGNDTLDMGTVNGGRVNGNKDTDTIRVATATSSTIFGGQGVDNITLLGGAVAGGGGTHSNALVSGDLGSDTINLQATTAAQGSLTNVTLSGGGGNDIINGNVVIATNTGMVANGGDGIDTINFAAATAVVTANGGNDGDVITGGIGADTLNGDAGADTIATTAGNDTVTGGTGNDTITLSGGTQRVVTQTGDSTAATVGASILLVGGGLTNDNSNIVFGNGVDVVNAFTTTTDTVATGTASATAYTSDTSVTTAAAGNYIIRGSYTAGNSTFNFDTGGADTMLIRANGASWVTAANIGDMSTIFMAAIIVGGDVVA